MDNHNCKGITKISLQNFQMTGEKNLTCFFYTSYNDHRIALRFIVTKQKHITRSGWNDFDIHGKSCTCTLNNKGCFMSSSFKKTIQIMSGLSKNKMCVSSINAQNSVLYSSCARTAANEVRNTGFGDVNKRKLTDLYTTLLFLA